MHNLMLDLETLGTSPGCVVLSIGAVQFTRDGISGEFHTHIDLESSFEAGLVMEPRTVMWWLDQSKEAQNAFLQAETFPLVDALSALIDTFKWKDLRVWANGASFDFPILKAAFQAADLEPPWRFYNEMDYRSIKNLVPKEVLNKLRVHPGIAHDALDDARAQALTLNALINWLGGETHEDRLLA